MPSPFQKQGLYAALIPAILLLFSPLTLAGEQSLVRFPTIHNDRIVFESGGNLWRVNTAGGEAVRLTADPGYDRMPRFSPDGKWIAFTGQYAGQNDVYVMPANGGAAKRLTFRSDVTPHAPLRWGPNNMTITWTPDSKSIIFLSRRNTFNSWFGRLFRVPVSGGLPTLLPLPKGGLLAYNRDGSRVAYNRIFRNFRTWRHYYGGLAQDIWVYDFKTKRIRRITHWKGTDSYPMWHGNSIYFASDRGPARIMNLWAYSLKTAQFRQLTYFKEYAIDWPSLGNSGIVFSQAGRLFWLKLPSEQLIEVPVSVPNDGVRTRPYWFAAERMIRSAAIAPNGKLAVFGARGDLFTVPVTQGATRDITRTSGAREQYPAWSPNGRWIAYVTDVGGKSEIAIRPATGTRPARELTRTKDRTYYGAKWSPDGHWLAYSDSSKTLWILNVKNTKARQIATDAWSEMRDFSFSPDSRWIAYSKRIATGMRILYLYSLATGKSQAVSHGWFSDSHPVFSRDGRRLFYVSARRINPTFSSNEFTVANLESDGIYVTNLRASSPAPFAPRMATPFAGKPTRKTGEKASRVTVKIDFSGLRKRSVPIPVPAANIRQLAEADGTVYYLTLPNPVLGKPLTGEKPALRAFDMKTRKGKLLVRGVRGFSLSADGKTLFYTTGPRQWFTRPAIFGKAKSHQLNLTRMQMRVDPRAEWREMYRQAWRLERNFFFNPQMNGRNWKAIGARYAKLLPRMNSREDLNYLIGRMIGSLGNSHTYVGGGYHLQAPKYVPTGALGADFARDEKSGRYYLSRIYRGDNTLSGYRAPLAQPGMKVRTGDYVLAINGKSLQAPTNPYALLVNTTGRIITLRVADNPSGRHTRTLLVKPIANALPLWLHAWVSRNREKVAKLSGGKIGYIYLSDMSRLGMQQFLRQFYPQLMKQGLIIDDRFNGGGFIDPVLLERLRRFIVALDTTRQRGAEPANAIALGYKAVLINHYSASDGDIFPWKFRKYGLGPVIGTRTWGGVRGIRGETRLMDGGYITIPEAAMYNPRSQWILENVGVEPDIRIDNPPGAVMSGRDPQLEKAVEVLLEKIRRHPPRLAPPPGWLPAYPPQPAYPPCPARITCG